MNLFNTDYKVYSHSYLCFGQEQTRAIFQAQLVQGANGSVVINDPCLQPGYVQNLSLSTLINNACVQGGFVVPTNLTANTTISLR